ncbi:MAG: helix-turn-helix domain-containing protein [Myxococcota bacterium]
MARSRPPDRFAALIAVATVSFVRAGVRRVQMDELARGLGVAKGTLYLYVESKEALFDACLRWARDPQPPATLPVPTPSEADTLGFVRRVAATEARLATLDTPDTPIDDVLAELYDRLDRNGTLLKLIAGSAVDWPELGAVWYAETRDAVIGRVERWIAGEPRLRAGLEPRSTARLVVETATWFAVHRRWDPGSDDPIPDAIARETALTALHHVLTEAPCPTRS